MKYTEILNHIKLHMGPFKPEYAERCPNITIDEIICHLNRQFDTYKYKSIIALRATGR